MPDIDCGMAIRPLNRFLSESGDTARIYQAGEFCDLVLIDVLGHGAQARVVAQRAERYVDVHHGEELLALLQGLHAHLLGTRGAVAACCRLHVPSGALQCSGIGNISVKVLRYKQETLITRDGVIGYHTIRPQIVETTLKPGDIVLMHSDGIRSTVNYIEQQSLLEKSATGMANTIIKEYGTKTDDACCIVMKYLREGMRKG
ncbi:MAG TPA: SpoIIE family protein phosphatase [Candidatus Limiplasma sp.]|nr:SpoIIE family protein phosphatase [Candidatus Limiplasma sp.]